MICDLLEEQSKINSSTLSSSLSLCLGTIIMPLQIGRREIRVRELAIKGHETSIST